VDVLANWMWQGAVVALASVAILRVSRRMSATTRYNLWWMTLVVVLCLPALAWLATLAVEPRGDSMRALGAAGPVTGTASAPAGPVILPAVPGWIAAAVAAFWLLWLTLSLGRLVSAYRGVRRVRRESREFPASRERRLPMWLAVRGEGRGVRLALSNDVRAAAVVGLASPTIAVAPRALDALSDAELDQIIVHEWAHVQRGDAAARLIQRIVTAVAGLHPAIWWIDRQLNLERETACDDWAVGAAGSGRRLAVCLTKLASLPGQDTGAVLSPSALVTSELSIRVTRLLDDRRNTSTRTTIGVPMVVTTVLAALAVTVAGVELVVTAPRSSVDQPVAVSEPIREHPPAGTIGPETPRQSSGPVAERTPNPAGRRVAPAADSIARRSVPPTPEAAASPDSARPDSLIAPVQSIAETPIEAGALPGTATEAPSALAATAALDAKAPEGPVRPATPWGAAANAGVTVGKGSQKAAVATAGFFTRLSKSISGAF
jgi:beta-lactamase regulating signal transducer with metallopeptidase domain